MSDLATRIVQYRAQNRLSQTEMAQKCGITAQTISLIERGAQKPTRVTLAKIEMIIGKENEDGEIQHITD